MTIDEAIKTLTTIETRLLDLGWAQSRDAIKLGIEALKHIQSWRHDTPTYGINLLPGETEE